MSIQNNKTKSKFSPEPIAQLQPQNIEAESTILGGILLDEGAIDRITDILKPEMFYVKSHEIIYRACVELHSQKVRPDLMTVPAYLQDKFEDGDMLQKIGGNNAICQLVERTVSSVNIDRYAALVADKWARRELIKYASNISSIGWNASLEPEELTNSINEQINEIKSLCGFIQNKSVSISKLRCDNLISKITEILLGDHDADYKTYLMWELEKESGFNEKRLYDLFYKSLISNENEKSMTLAELKLKYGSQVREWLLHGFIPKGTTTLIHAMGGKGKTRLMYDFIFHLGQGINWQGFPVTKKAKMLIIQTDEQPMDMTAALEQRGIDESFDIYYKTKWTSDHVHELYKEVEQERYDFILIDSLSSISKFSTVSENDAEFARPILFLNKIASDFGTSIMMIHHSSKAGDARGTTATYNAVSQVLQLKEDTEDKRVDSCNRILLIQKSRSRRPAAYKLEFDPIDGSWNCLGEENPNSITGMDADGPVRDAIVNFLDNNRGIKYENTDLAECLGISEASVRRATLRLRQDGLISWKKKGKYNQFWLEPIVTDNVKECNKRSPKEGGDRMGDRMVIVSHRQDEEQDFSTCDHAITENEKKLEKKLEKKCDQGDRMIATPENTHPVNSSGYDHPCDHQAITCLSSDRENQDDQTSHDSQSSKNRQIEQNEAVWDKDDPLLLGIVKAYLPLADSYEIEWVMSDNPRTGEVELQTRICRRDQFLTWEELR